MNASNWAAIVVACLAIAGLVWQGGRLSAILDRVVDMVDRLDQRQRDDHDKITQLEQRQAGG